MFGTRLKELRREHNMTQKELGKKINISDRVIGYYESGDRFPSDEKVLKDIADLFSVSVDYLLGVTDEKNIYKLSEDELPQELREVGVEYITLAKEMQDKQIPPEDIKKILDVISKNK